MDCGFSFFLSLASQIYKDGKFSHFIDGSEEYLSSWMRFIQCARYKEEQNMTVFQYCGNIYYRAYRHIPPGRELLVWYDEKYSEFIDVPALMKARVVKGLNFHFCYFLDFLPDRLFDRFPSFYLPFILPFFLPSCLPACLKPEKQSLSMSPTK